MACGEDGREKLLGWVVLIRRREASVDSLSSADASWYIKVTYC